MKRQPHGQYGTRFYKIWGNMKNRCSPKSHCGKHKKLYIDKGITVCKRWHSFVNFLADMKESYDLHVATHGERHTSIDRIDGTKGYSPKNCRWATPKVQNINRPQTVWVTFRGETKAICDWARKFKVTYQLLWWWVNHDGLTYEQAVEKAHDRHCRARAPLSEVTNE